MKSIKFGNTEVVFNWERNLYSDKDSSCFIHCINYVNGKYTFINLLEEDNKCQLRFTGFPIKEYYLMYGDNARFDFDSLQEAKDHVESFLTRLDKLMVFL